MRAPWRNGRSSSCVGGMSRARPGLGVRGGEGLGGGGAGGGAGGGRRDQSCHGGRPVVVLCFCCSPRRCGQKSKVRHGTGLELVGRADLVAREASFPKMLPGWPLAVVAREGRAVKTTVKKRIYSLREESVRKGGICHPESLLMQARQACHVSVTGNKWGTLTLVVVVWVRMSSVPEQASISRCNRRPRTVVPNRSGPKRIWYGPLLGHVASSMGIPNKARKHPDLSH